MPLLGIFGRKNKSSRSDKDAPPSSIYSQTSEVDSILSSPAEYGTRERPLPSFPNGKSHLHPRDALNVPGSSKPPGKLRFFGRRKASAPPASPTTSPLYDTVESVMIPQPSYLGRTSIASTLDGDSDPRIRPPPSKTALFGAYGDPHSALSTHSLPNDTTHDYQRSNTFAGAEQPKKPAFFQWKSSPASSVKSNPVHTTPMEPPSPSPNQSFNLKGFRHVRPPSPTRSDAGNNTSTTSLSAPIPRPRGLSTTSDASQRISVAAFREAQARRSTAGSPVPSRRSPSPNTSTSPNPLLDNSRGRSNPQLRPSPILPQANAVANRSSRARSVARSIDSDSNESEEESEGSEDDKTRRAKGNALPGRAGAKARAQSELGHGVPRDSYNRRPQFTPAPRSNSAYVAVDNKTPAPASRPQQPDSAVYGANVRSRASVSTSALTPNAAARRASTITTANADAKGASRHSRDLSTPSNPWPVNPQDGSDSDDDDDAPLAALVGPRKPGSAMSSATNLHASTRPGPKPLIDINDLVGKPPKRTDHKDDGFVNNGKTLLSGRLTSSPTQEIPPVPAVVTRTPPVKFISPPTSPRIHSRQLSTSTITPTPPQPSPAADSQKSHSAAPTPDTRRDIFSERLTRAVQKQVGTTSAAASTTSKETPSSSPASEHMPLRIPPVQAAPKAKPIPIPHATPAASMAVSSTPEEDLADLLGAGIKLVSRTGESSSESEYSESSESESEDEEKPATEPIAPIPIRERTPPPAFSVTSRPQRPRTSSVAESAIVVSTSTSTITTATSMSTTSSVATKVASVSPKPQTPVLAPAPANRKRSSTVVPASNSSSSFGLSQRPPESPKSIAPPSSSAVPASSNPRNGDKPVSTRPSVTAAAPPGSRQRSSTMAPLISPSMFPPRKPFATRGDSPASSTGGSSSGRVPLTPRDGSDIASVSTSSRVKIEDSKPRQPEWSGGASGLGLAKNKNHVKRRSVSFEDDLPSGDEESKRRERRRSEAKAAIELGNVINGKGPIMVDEDEPPINQAIPIPRIAPVNPMMNMGMGMGMNMNMGMGMPMMNYGTPPGSPGWSHMGPMLTPAQFIPPTPADPALLAAHQQAMMYAKQAYQMAVAQQAMAAAADEWERGSAVSGYGGGGGGSVYGGGGGSVYGGSAYGGYGNGWSTGSMVFPNSASSMYGGGFSSSRSEYGGHGGRQSGRSSSRSTYGESFGPDRFGHGGKSSRHGGRDSMLLPPVPPIPQHADGQRREREREREGSSSRSSALLAPPTSRTRTTSQPANPTRGNLRKAPPPSSWKQAAK